MRNRFLTFSLFIAACLIFATMGTVFAQSIPSGGGDGIIGQVGRGQSLPDAFGRITAINWNDDYDNWRPK